MSSSNGTLSMWYRCEDDQIVRFEEISNKQEISVEVCWSDERRKYFVARFKQFDFEIPGSMELGQALGLVDKIAIGLGYTLNNKKLISKA